MEGMKYGKYVEVCVNIERLTLFTLAVHYTHATATFCASFLLRLARLLYAFIHNFQLFLVD